MEATATEASKQTFLAGEGIYLRPLEKGHAKQSVAVRQSPYPVSPARVEAWIEEDLDGEQTGLNTYAIIRAADDVVVGSISWDGGTIRAHLQARVSPAYGERGLAWKAEALAVLTDYLSNEREIPSLVIALPVTESVVIDRLRTEGLVEVTRFREKRLVAGQRVDEVILQKFQRDWLQTLGDPMQDPIERTGTGIPRPGTPRLANLADPPKNAVAVGARIYLRPWLTSDAAEIVRWNRRETETFHMAGRQLLASDYIRNDAESDEKAELPQYIFFSVCERGTDRLIGEVGLIDVDYIDRVAETASWIHVPEFRSSGYGSEAKHLLLEYAFEVLDLHMLVSWVRIENTRSAAALRKQGYRDAGRVAWTSHWRGYLGGFQTFDLLRSEWRALQAATMTTPERTPAHV